MSASFDVQSVFQGSSLSNTYDLLELAGEGNMGVVHKGRHKIVGCAVAIKFCKQDRLNDRFRREAKALGQVQSPHVVPFRDFEDTKSGHSLLVMNWIVGTDLARIVHGSSAPVPEKRVVRWMVQVCEGMRDAAQTGIVHRDLKPSNILVDSSDRAYIADFGLARSEESDSLTMEGTPIGTPHYMAPEQGADASTVDTRADIYSFGATFYHMLTGQTPFAGKNWMDILIKHKTEFPVAPRTRNPALSKPINDVIECCMAKSPLGRFQTFESLLAHLRPDADVDDLDILDGSGNGPMRIHLQTYRDRRPIYLSRRAESLPHPDTYQFAHGRVCTVGFGDLLEQRTDALVSPDDEALSMGRQADGSQWHGVAWKLQQAAGDGYREAALKFAPVRPGRAFPTPAGKLLSRFVLHGITKGHWQSEWIGPSRDLINEIMESCFYHADSLGLRSIAFPLLGAGQGHFSREECLDTMFRFLIRKMARGLTTVQEARIVIRPSDNAEAETAKDKPEIAGDMFPTIPG
jgi:serine/threonine protein kinase